MPRASLIAAIFAVLAMLAAAQSKSEARRQAAATNQIALSPDVATGLVAGLFLLGLLIFGINMLAGIEASDKIGQPKPELTQ